MAGVLPLFKKKKETILSLETIELYAGKAILFNII
jgi:hypothetical protein